MKAIPNDDFDMCCGGRPQIGEHRPGGYFVWCGICGDGICNDNIKPHELMIAWNKRQREKVENETPPQRGGRREINETNPTY